MSETTANLRRKIDSAGELQSVVRTMKALAASSIGQYEQSVLALGDYYRTVELGLSICFRQSGLAGAMPAREDRADVAVVNAIVFGSDQGLVGRFNEVVADFSVKKLAALPGKRRIWAVGERVFGRLSDAGLRPTGSFTVPTSAAAIGRLVGQLLVECHPRNEGGEAGELHLFHNRPIARAGFEPVTQRLLPLDDIWRHRLVELPWPTRSLPQVLGDQVDNTATLRSLIREHIFVSLFMACAESLASENASRLAAMQLADKNIDELLQSLNGSFHRLRQSGIDEELFDVMSGFEALNKA